MKLGNRDPTGTDFKWIEEDSFNPGNTRMMRCMSSAASTARSSAEPSR